MKSETTAQASKATDKNLPSHHSMSGQIDITSINDQRPIAMKKHLPLILLVLLAGLAIILINHQKIGITLRQPGPNPEINYELLIDTSSKQAHQRNINALRIYELEINRIIKKHEPRLLSAADKASSAVAEYKSCCSLIYCLAWDEVEKTHSADNYLKKAITPYLQPALKEFSNEINHAINQLNYDLNSSTMQFATDLANVAPNLPPSSQTEVNPKMNHEEFQQALRNLGLDASITGVAITFDIYALSQSTLMKKLWQKMKEKAAKTFAKQTAKLAGSALAVAVDGPLPIGDIIAGIGCIWTAWDIHTSRKDFQKDIRASLHNHLLTSKENLHKQAVDHANTLITEHQKLHERIGQESVDQLK